MIYLTHRAHFCASHRYYNPGLSEEKNRDIFDATTNPHGHGHNYYAELTVAGSVNKHGVVPFWRPFTKTFNDFIDNTLDHTFINTDVAYFSEVIPTTENLAKFIWEEMAVHLPEGALIRVRVWEDPDLYADYCGK